MYIPRHNEEKHVPVVQAFMVSNPFATLVALGAQGLFASHIPMVFENDGSQFGVLKGHISRANAQWRNFDSSVDALAIFAGHHHYVSPSWYSENEAHSGQVPTWNYAVVHAYGALKATEDGQWLLDHVSSLTDIHEAAFPTPWKVSDAPHDHIRSLLHGIIGLELPIRRLEGKWKVSQNRTDREKQGVIDGLTRVNTPESLAMKALVEARRDRSDS